MKKAQLKKTTTLQDMVREIENMKDAEGNDMLQIEVVGDNEGLFLVANGVRIAFREKQRWVSCGCEAIKMIAYDEDGNELACIAYGVEQWREIMADIEMKVQKFVNAHHREWVDIDSPKRKAA